MPDIKEKLVELLLGAEGLASERGFFNCHHSEPKVELVADHLIANGVTIQKWISVEEFKPKAHQLVLVHYRDGAIDTAYWMEILQRFTGYGLYGDATHWMPLPEPPKGE